MTVVTKPFSNRIAVVFDFDDTLVQDTVDALLSSLGIDAQKFRQERIRPLIYIYEETPDIHKEAVVREEVRVKKVVDRDTVEAQEKVRREELDIDTDGRPIDERRI